MLAEQKQLITKNWIDLMKINEIDSLASTLVEKGTFTQREIDDIFSSADGRYNKTVFLFTLQDKDETAFEQLVQWLTSMGHHNLALRLSFKKSGCTPFRQPEEEEEEEGEDEITSSIETELPSIPTNDSQIPLRVQVNLADEFFDTKKHNPHLGYYHSRSKKRGRVLIINNYDFAGTSHTFRTGANVDQQNLEDLFTQMGGWVIEHHKNKTAEEMRVILKDFVKDQKQKRCDICFVIIMSHGAEKLNTTIVYGVDGKYISTNDIQSYFINENCALFRGKPKVFIYQVCRGGDLDLPRTYTEADGKCTSSSVPSAANSNSMKSFFRPVDDMLIGFATMQGSRAHRDRYRGTWYIELICENFMNLAKLESVDHLLYKVDEGLRKRISESHTVQTSETISKGFKKLYLNPGIYEVNGKLTRF